MTKKKRLRNLQEVARREKLMELERLRILRRDHPDLFRLCGPKNLPCCQAYTKSGNKCSRPAMTQKFYIESQKCCLVCWQHALNLGVYFLLWVADQALQSSLSWEEYCFMYPEVCAEKLKVQLNYDEKENF